MSLLLDTHTLLWFLREPGKLPKAALAAHVEERFPFPEGQYMVFGVSTITAILKPDADGTLHLPLPAGWGDAAIRVKADLEPVETPRTRAIPGLWKDLPGTFWMAPDFDAPLDDFRDLTG